MVGLLLNLLILLLVFGVVYYIITLLPIPDPFKRIAMVIMALILLLMLLGMVGVLPGWHYQPLLVG